MRSFILIVVAGLLLSLPCCNGVMPTIGGWGDPPPRSNASRNRTLRPGQHVLAFEKIDRSDVSGVWAVFYEGSVTNLEPGAAQVQVQRRFGFRYRQTAPDGVNATDWWCVPAKRYCYSEVSFTDWGGTLSQGQAARFASDQVWPMQEDIVATVKWAAQLGPE